MSFDRITINADQMGGMPCIRGMRIPVATVVGMVADGMETPEILSSFPDLEREDISQALRYAAEAVAERELPLRPGAGDSSSTSASRSTSSRSWPEPATPWSISATWHATSEDRAVLDLARTERRVLLSVDADFGTLVARTGASSPSVILFRRSTGRRRLPVIE